jgi:outer membrane cobalamin receptor
VDLLRSMPGVSVTQQGGPAGFAFVSLRGGDPNFTVVMIDGVKVDDPTNSMGGGFDFVGLDPLLIERIDVYFGSYSAVHGSGALGGAISITTRAPGAARQATLDLEAGTDEERAGAVHLKGDLSSSVQGSLALVAREGNDAVEGDSLERRQLSLSLRNAPGSSSSVGWAVNLFASDGEAGYFPIASGGPRLAVLRDVERKDFEQLNGGASLELVPTTHWHSRLMAGVSRYEAQIASPAVAPGVLAGVPPIDTDSEFERASVLFSNTLSIPRWPLLGFGGELSREEGRIDSVIDFGFPIPADFDQTRETWALFGEVALALGRQGKLVATVRHDDVEEISSTNARIALSVGDPTARSASLMYTQGFKLPSLFALGHPLTGNPDLDPESSDNYELTLRQAFANRRANVALTFFYNEFKDLIDFDPLSFSHVNRASARAQGAELSVTAQLGRCAALSASVGHLDTKVDDGTHLEGRPEWKGGVSASCAPADGWLVSLDGTINGQFYDVAVPTGERLLDGYTRLDVSIRRSLSSKADVKLLLANILDEDYEEAIGFPDEGRQVRLGIAVRL